LADNKAFAKAVATRKTFIFALLMSIKYLALLLALWQDNGFKSNRYLARKRQQQV
jgi:hypothetical protein